MKISELPYILPHISFGAKMSEHLGQGARYQKQEGTKFRLTAPLAVSADVFVVKQDDFENPQKYSLEKYGDTFETIVKNVAAGDKYKYKITDTDGNEQVSYDPRADYLPNDIGGFRKNSDWAEVIDHSDFKWEDDEWLKKRNSSALATDSWQLPQDMITEDIHIGLLGGFKGAKKEIDKIAKTQVANTVRMMPVGEFYGNINWGYDEVAKFAVENAYGTPDDFKDFVNHAHKKGIRVILDIVPNHFGPFGNVVDKFIPIYNKDKFSPWGGNILEYNGQEGKYARSYITDMMMNWAVNYHVDGFRMDATQQMDSDEGLREILSELRSHEETRDLIIYPEDMRISRALANSKLPKEINEFNFGFDGITTFDFYKSICSLATKNNVHDFSPNTYVLEGIYKRGVSWTNEESCVNNPDIDKGFRDYCAELIKKPMLSANNMIVDISNQDEIGNDAGGKRNIVNILASRTDLYSRFDGDWKQAQRMIFDMIKSYAKSGRVLDEEVQKEQYDCKRPITNEEFDTELHQSFELSKIMLGALFMHPGAKEFFMGEDRGELAPFKFFCNKPRWAKNPWTNQRYIDEIADEKGYRTDKTAFNESKISKGRYSVPWIKGGTTRLAQDLKSVLNDSPAMKNRSFENIATYSYPDMEVLEVKYYDEFNNETIAVMNFSPNAYKKFRLNTTSDIKIKEILNSNAKKYSGRGEYTNKRAKNLRSNRVTIPPYSIIIFEKISQQNQSLEPQSNPFAREKD